MIDTWYIYVAAAAALIPASFRSSRCAIASFSWGEKRE
jgi:hypothetical protein